MPDAAGALSFRVAGWAAAFGSEPVAIHSDPGESRPAPVSLRRRITAIGRTALGIGWPLHAGLDSPRIVFSSRHGEYDRTEALLHSLVESGEVSPAEFSLSVHHALAGLLSIATGNRAGHSAVAAGPESFGYGLLEAAAAANEDHRPVLLVHFDDVLPEAYAPFSAPDDRSEVVGLVLAPPEADGGVGVLMEMEPSSSGQDGLAGRFVEFLESGDNCSEARGPRMTWRWRRAD